MKMNLDIKVKKRKGTKMNFIEWVASCHSKNQNPANISYPQLWYCWPRWTKRIKWVHHFKTWLCGKTIGHEWSRTEIGYSSCGVDRWCRWCDKIVTMPRCESPLSGEMKDLAASIKKFPTTDGL
jgi:hypothetical protein